MNIKLIIGDLPMCNFWDWICWFNPILIVLPFIMYAFRAYISEHSDSEIISGSKIDGGPKNFWCPYVPQYNRNLDTRFEHLIPLTFWDPNFWITVIFTPSVSSPFGFSGILTGKHHSNIFVRIKSSGFITILTQEFQTSFFLICFTGITCIASENTIINVVFFILGFIFKFNTSINHIRVDQWRDSIIICLCFDQWYCVLITIIYSAVYHSNMYLRLESVDCIL